jgi:glycosyltransferase involved in cell wall biosynthesis
MKIAFDAKRALNNSTGLGNHSRILINALMRDFPEHEYLLFSPRAKDEFSHQLNGRFKIIFPETRLAKSFHPIWRSYGVNRQLEKERANIFHGLSNEIPIRNHKSNVRSVVTIHDLIFLKHTEQYPFIDRQIYEMKTRYAAKHADQIIAVSNETKKDLIEYYHVHERKIEVIYPSVDIQFQALKSEDEIESIRRKYSLPNKYILNVGSFFPRKNQKTLIEAFDLIKNKVEEDLLFVGSYGDTQRKMEELIEKKNLRSRIKIVSGISNNNLPAVYQAASLFVFPSLVEGFGAPVLEALFSRVPVIATKEGAIQEAGGRNSVYINPLNAEEIANVILSVLKNEEIRTRMIEGGNAHARNMTDKVFAQKTMSVYKGICG